MQASKLMRGIGISSLYIPATLPPKPLNIPEGFHCRAFSDKNKADLPINWTPMVTTAEIIRLFVFPILGLLLMFVLQPTLYQSRVINLEDVKVDKWLPSGYYPPASLVFGCAIFAALIWVIWNTMSPPPSNAAARGRSVAWWVLSLIPLLSIAGGVVWSRIAVLGKDVGSDQATLTLTFFFMIDVLLLYWLTTATSTPGLAKYLPPGAGLFRK
jgi:hypothetical protein